MKLGIDIGGTKMVAGIVDGLGRISGIYEERTRSTSSKEEVVDQVAALVDRFLTDETSVVGIGVPAVVDAEKGIVYNAVSIPSWDEVPLKSMLEERFKVPVSISNDCNCFASGILASPEYSAYENLVCITLGTGVGAGLVLGRKLYTGHDSLAGEIGSIPYLDKDYEFYCSSRLFISKGTTGKEAFERACAGDADAMALWSELGSHLGNLLQTVLYAYNPQAIVLGGSIANAYQFFKDAMMERLSCFPYPKIVSGLSIHLADTNAIMLTGAVSAF